MDSTLPCSPPYPPLRDWSLTTNTTPALRVPPSDPSGLRTRGWSVHRWVSRCGSRGPATTEIDHFDLWDESHLSGRRGRERFARGRLSFLCSEWSSSRVLRPDRQAQPCMTPSRADGCS